MTEQTDIRSRAVFLDRDGTIIDALGYLGDPEQVVFYNTAVSSLKQLAAAGYRLVVVTNQSGIGRGYFSEEAAQAVNQRFLMELAAGSVTIDALYYCPHHPDDGCRCRKPAPLMLERAAEDLALDLAASWMVGDTARDAAAGLAAGCRAILVAGGKSDKGPVPEAAVKAADLADATRLILEEDR